MLQMSMWDISFFVVQNSINNLTKTWHKVSKNLMVILLQNTMWNMKQVQEKKERKLTKYWI
jgi:hypothetical protein